MLGSMLRRASFGDGSTLTLDFTTGLLDSRLSFTRSTTATYINSSGYVTIAGINSPRFQYDQLTGVSQGLLIESSSANLMTYSDSCWGGSWGRGAGCQVNSTAGSSVDSGKTSASRINGPDNVTTSATSLNITTGGFGSYIRMLGVSVTADLYTASLWVRVPSGSSPTFTLSIVQGGHVATTGRSSHSVTISNGSPSNFTSFPSDTWVRVEVTTNSALTAGTADIYIYGSTGSTAVVHVWGVQLEKSNRASSYMPASASTATRAADSCVMTGTNFSSWFNATEGTFVAKARRIRTTDTGRVASANDDTANESIDLAADTTGKFVVIDNGSTLASIAPGTVSSNTSFSIAGAYKLNDVQSAVGGTLGTQDTSVTLPTVTQLMIGQQGGASPVYLNGTVASLKYWPTRLPDETLQSLTT